MPIDEFEFDPLPIASIFLVDTTILIVGGGGAVGHQGLLCQGSSRR